ncbi:MAG: antitoxin family protein [Chloroflexi bacterium]|nr:antitoxin family protein [Chloroflexota bacterium]
METIIAIYEHGVFRPLSPVTLPESVRIELQVVQQLEATAPAGQRFSFIGIGHSGAQDLSDRIEDMLDDRPYDRDSGWKVE